MGVGLCGIGNKSDLYEMGPVGGVLQLCVEDARLEAQGLGCSHCQVAQRFLLLVGQDGRTVGARFVEIAAPQPTYSCSCTQTTDLLHF